MPNPAAPLVPVTAFGEAAPRRRSHGALELIERPDLSLASIALTDGVLRPDPFGLKLPEVGRLVTGEDILAFWTARSRWMVGAWDPQGQDIAGKLKEAFPEAMITEQTDAWTAIEIASGQGPSPIVALLGKTVDIDPDALDPGAASFTAMHHTGAFLLRISESRLLVLGMRSMAGSLWDSLEITARHLAEF